MWDEESWLPSSWTTNSLAMAELSLSDIRREFDGICSRLNMDQATLEVAWKSFHDLKEFYTLEVL